ncbi:MAG: DUF3038 domain-containing protein [Synechococcales cyanobacterium]
MPAGLVTPSSTIVAYLDLLLLGLEALAGESSEAVLSTAKTLGLEALIHDRVGLWRIRNASPLRRSSGGRKKVDIDEARALVLIIHRLAQEHQQRLRDTLLCLEKAFAEERSPYQEPTLAHYLEEFHAHYRSRMVDGDSRSQDSITEQAVRLLIELHFYSSKHGQKRLWGSLMERPAVPEWPESETADAESVTEATPTPVVQHTDG